MKLRDRKNVPTLGSLVAFIDHSFGFPVCTVDFGVVVHMFFKTMTTGLQTREQKLWFTVHWAKAGQRTYVLDDWLANDVYVTEVL